jgi:hypothetical protein
MEYIVKRKVLAFFVAPLAAIFSSGAFCLVEALVDRTVLRNMREWAGAAFICSLFALPVAYVATLLGGSIALAWSHTRHSPITRSQAVWWGLVGGLLAGVISAYAAFTLSWPSGSSTSALLTTLTPFLGIAIPTGGASGLLFQLLLGPPEAG